MRFDRYTLREVTEADYLALEEWIAADPSHASFFEPDFFLGREVDSSGQMAADPRASCYALEDDSGVVFFLRLQRAARVFIQFPPLAPKEAGQSKRVSLGLLKGMAFLEVALARAGAAEWVFSSESPNLRKLAQKALGFSESRTEMVRPIARLQEPEKTLQGLKQFGEEGA